MISITAAKPYLSLVSHLNVKFQIKLELKSVNLLVLNLPFIEQHFIHFTTYNHIHIFSCCTGPWWCQAKPQYCVVLMWLSWPFLHDKEDWMALIDDLWKQKNNKKTQWLRLSVTLWKQNIFFFFYYYYFTSSSVSNQSLKMSDGWTALTCFNLRFTSVPLSSSTTMNINNVITHWLGLSLWSLLVLFEISLKVCGVCYNCEQCQFCKHTILQRSFVCIMILHYT